MNLPSVLPSKSKGSNSKWNSIARQIDRMETQLEQVDDQTLRKNSLSLRYQARSGTPLNRLIVEAFALVRESAKRTLGMRHYPVQILGGIAIHFGSIAVMQTGEGKTLTATLPMYLAALSGEGTHLATANDYLAERDAEIMAPVYELLGMSIGVVQSNTLRPNRLKAYRSDITYTTAKEIGFDFLRDRLLKRQHDEGDKNLLATMLDQDDIASSIEPVQRKLNFLLVDEADSILIDEARTPLIVSSLPDNVAREKSELYQWAAKVSDLFKEDEHFEVDSATNQVTLSEAGRKLVRRLPHEGLLAQTPLLDLYDHAEQAIQVDRQFTLDRHYVVRDGEVVIVDEFTGRLAEGRQWRAGLHQAIEAREDLPISVETGEAAQVTIQDLTLKYESLCGMTGTVANSAPELKKIYSVNVCNVPTNKPPKRKRLQDLVFGTEEQKWQAIVGEIIEIHETGRPVLVGTRSIDKSMIVSQKLLEAGIVHDVLNANNLTREAEIVEGAGQVGRVTVATNMAGRGTDIKLSEDAASRGGLHVICTELHDSARIDRQLIGRCGRQGDPGTYRQYLCLEDDILKSGLGVSASERLLNLKHHSPSRLKQYAGYFRRAQAKIERQHFRARKILLYREKQRRDLQREMGQDPYLDTSGT